MQVTQKSQMAFFEGIPIHIPNEVRQNDPSFYISYNPSSRDYGCPTTALVLKDTQMTKFYILCGDHRKQYGLQIPLKVAQLISEVFRTCDILTAMNNIPTKKVYVGSVPLESYESSLEILITTLKDYLNKSQRTAQTQPLILPMRMMSASGWTLYINPL